MKNLFPGYYKPSEEEFSKLWAECIFIFDTNILLNVYRYSENTRERLFEILNLLQDRIWLPYQVAYEYQEERLNVISNQLEPYTKIEKVLNDNLEKLDSAIELYRKRHSFTSLVNDKKIIDTTKRANKRIIIVLEEAKQQYPDLIQNDPYREKIGELFLNKIGTLHNEENLDQVYIKCASRFEKEQPPGYKDKGKTTKQKRYGDAILWLQMIEYAKAQDKPIIFVTDDNKDDWWKKHQGQTISPRTELIEEMKAEANIDFWMYTGDRFLMYAEDYLKLNEQPETIEEAKTIRRELGKESQNIVRNMAELVKLTMPYPQDNSLLDKSILSSFDSQASVTEELEKSLMSLKEMLEIRGEEHPDLATNLNKLATLYLSQGRYEEAETMFLKALEIYRRVLGEEHPNTVKVRNNLASLKRKLE